MGLHLILSEQEAYPYLPLIELQQVEVGAARRRCQWQQRMVHTTVSAARSPIIPAELDQQRSLRPLLLPLRLLLLLLPLRLLLLLLLLLLRGGRPGLALL